jgi:hypothetical protein
VASIRPRPFVALLLGFASVAFLIRDWNALQDGATRTSRESAQTAVSGATLCLATIVLTSPTATLVRICLMLVAGALGVWANFRYHAPEAAAPD